MSAMKFQLLIKILSLSMKKDVLIFTLLIIGFTNLFSQTSSYDINILIKKKTDVLEITNDTISYQEFTLKERINYLKKEINFNRKGFLTTKLKVSHTNKDTRLIFIYKNIKNTNPPIVSKKIETKNLLTYPKDFENVEIEKMRKLINNAKNIYIIESDVTIDYYLLKKVTLSDRLSNL